MSKITKKQLELKFKNLKPYEDYVNHFHYYLKENDTDAIIFLLEHSLFREQVEFGKVSSLNDFFVSAFEHCFKSGNKELLDYILNSEAVLDETQENISRQFQIALSYHQFNIIEKYKSDYKDKLLLFNRFLEEHIFNLVCTEAFKQNLRDNGEECVAPINPQIHYLIVDYAIANVDKINNYIIEKKKNAQQIIDFIKIKLKKDLDEKLEDSLHNDQKNKFKI